MERRALEHDRHAARFKACAVATLKWKASSMYCGVVIKNGNGTAPPRC